MSKSQVALKQIGKVITIRLPYTNTPVTLYQRENQNYNELVNLVKAYNRWNQPRHLDKINELLDVYTKPLPAPEVVENRIQRKLAEKQLYDLKQQNKNPFAQYEGIEGLTVYPDKVTLTGFNFALPDDYIQQVKMWNDAGEDLTPLYNFMYLLASNPVEHVRTNLFTFMKKHKFLLTPNGYMVTFRNVDLYTQGVNDALAKFVQDWYVRVKMQRKSVGLYNVYSKNGTYRCSRYAIQEGELLEGNLKDLYEAEKETVYTDNYTKTFRIKIGEIVSMDRALCDSSNESCSRGLHQASLQGLTQHYASGTHTLMCLVNPALVVSVPYFSKFRCCEYLPVAEIDRSNIDEFWKDEYRLYDEDYAQIDFERIKQQVFEQQDTIKYETSDNGTLKQIEVLKDKLTSFRKRNITGETVNHLSTTEVETILNSRLKLVA